MNPNNPSSDPSWSEPIISRSRVVSKVIRSKFGRYKFYPNPIKPNPCAAPLTQKPNIGGGGNRPSSNSEGSRTAIIDPTCTRYIRFSLKSATAPIVNRTGTPLCVSLSLFLSSFAVFYRVIWMLKRTCQFNGPGIRMPNPHTTPHESI